jgi:small subunit ribosomal protein S20
MPITKGAMKADRQAKRRRIYNIRRKSVLADAVKGVEKAVLSGDAAKAKELLPKAYQAIDKAAKRGVIKDNTASRKKARLTKRVKETKTA